MYRFVSESPEQTMDFAMRLAELLQPGDVLTLEGDLGAGKTTFTKGIAKGLGVKRTVNSPTFTIIKEYQGRLPLYHMDVYRVESGEEDFGFEEYFEGEGITIVEWAKLIEEQLPEERLMIELFHQGDDKREIALSPSGEKYVEICEELFES